MKKLLITIGAVIAAIGTATAADGLTSNDYDTFTDACNSCTGGETITFNGNVSEAIGGWLFRVD